MLQGDEFDGGSTTCRACLALPITAAPAARAKAPVTRTRTTPRAPAPAAPAPAGPRPALLGVTGSGDLEVRERRARRAALEALATSHPEEFGLLLRDARLVEGLRPQATGPADSVAPDSAALDVTPVEAGQPVSTPEPDESPA